ncbi:hypothetical protein ACWFNE_02550 [Cellulomonas sp. NPDC055163]
MPYAYYPRAGRSYKSAVFDQPPTPEQIEALHTDSVAGVYLRHAALAPLKRGDLDWLADLESLQVLQLDCSRATQIPDAALRRLKALEVWGTPTQVVHTEQLPEIVELVVNSPKRYAGALSACPHLDLVGIGRYEHPDLHVLDGCTALRSVKIRARHHVIDLGWNTPPSRVESLVLDDARLTRLDGVAQLPRLQRLRISGRPPEPDAEVDVSPLAQCPELEWLQIITLGTLTHIDALATLPRLRSFAVYDGRYHPADVTGVSLDVVTRPRRRSSSV